MHSVAKDAEDNRFEQIHRAAVEKRRTPTARNATTAG